MCERAASEVLGEMLLLVIAILLAVAFANYSSNVIPPFRNTPQTRIAGYVNGSNYTLVVQCGDPIQLSDLSLVVTYNYSYTSARTLDYRYNHTAGSIAVLTAGKAEAWLFLRPGYYNMSWSFGEKLNVPRDSSKSTKISVCSGDEVVARLYFPEG